MIFSIKDSIKKSKNRLFILVLIYFQYILLRCYQIICENGTCSCRKKSSFSKFKYWNFRKNQQSKVLLAYKLYKLLINLSQTAYVGGLTLSNCRFLYKDSIGINIIFIRAIGARFMPGEGAIKINKKQGFYKYL